MQYLKILVFLITVIGSSVCTYSQEKKEEIQISLLTCSPGNELYSTFGHSAIRIIDPYREKDIVFDFGVFEINTPNFLWKFLKGSLKYHLEQREFEEFKQSYQKENRWVTEEEFCLTTNEKYLLYDFLLKNYRPENRYYQYNFLYDNCSTRIRDLILNLHSNIHWNNLPVNNITTFRDNLNVYLNEKKWIKLGIDILLGETLDKQMTFMEKMFLPNQLSLQMGNASISNNNNKYSLLKPAKTIIEQVIQKEKELKISPFYTFVILLILAIFMLYKKPYLQEKAMWLFLGLMGLLGCAILFMMLFTNLPATKMNWNIFWANPFYIFYPLVKSQPAKTYFLKVLVILNIALLFFWQIIPQQFNQAVLPLIGIMLLLGILRLKYFRTSKSSSIQ